MPIHVRSSAPVPPVILLPGDPDRAQWIAENCLENAQCTTTYRRMLGYSGTWHGLDVGVQTTGMGGPSAAIVCEELVTLGAKFFVRVGTCGAMRDGVNPGDLLIVTAACMSDGTSKEILRAQTAATGLDLGFPATSDFAFVSACADIAKTRAIPHHLGKIASLDRFYGHPMSTYETLAKLGIYAVEMEAATVLTIAAVHGLRAAVLLTVSDMLDGQKRADEATIQNGVARMVDVALEAASRTM